MADIADLDYVHVIQRLGATVGDTPDDVDSDPDFVPVTEGTITIVPTTPETKVIVNGAPVSVMNAPIVCTVDSQGYLSYGGTRGVSIVDLGSSKVTPPVPRDKAAYTVTYSGLKFGTQTFKKASVNINPDSVALAGADFNLTEATSLPLPAGVTLEYIQSIADEAVAAKNELLSQKGQLGGIAALDATTGDVLDASGQAVTGATDAAVAGFVTGGGETEAALTSTIEAGTATLRALPRLTDVAHTAKSAVSVFQPGHGWTVTNKGTGTDLNDTTDVGLGTQSAKVATIDGGGTPATVFDSPTVALDFTTSDLAILCKVEGVENIDTAWCYVASDTGFADYVSVDLASEEVGGPDASWVKDGEWGWLVFPASIGSTTGTPDLSSVVKLRFRLTAKAGTQATFHFGGVFTRAKAHTLFPNGVVSFTYDDGRTTGLTKGRQRLDLYGWSGTSYPIRDRIGNPGGGTTYADLSDLIAAQRLSGWEISCHADTAADHDTGFSNLTPDQVMASVYAERQWFYANGIATPSGLAWPRGLSTKAVEDAARSVATYGRGVYTDNNTTRETLPPADVMRLRAFEVGSGVTLSQATAQADKIQSSGGWIIYAFHEVRDALLDDGAPECLATTHDGIIDYVAGMTNPPVVLPVAEVLRRLG